MRDRMIIAVCCENFDQATRAYHEYINFLKETEPEYLEECDKHTLTVKFGNVFCYVFFDEKLSQLFIFADSILYLDEFFFLEGVTDPLEKLRKDGELCHMER